MRHLEDNLQKSVFRYFCLQYPEKKGLLFHPANGGKRDAMEAAKFKAMGVLPGVCDLLLIHDGKLHGIELKTQKGKLSPAQKELHLIWEKAGVTVFTCYGLDEAIKVIDGIIKG
jgi:hypothetical protein